MLIGNIEYEDPVLKCRNCGSELPWPEYNRCKVCRKNKIRENGRERMYKYYHQDPQKILARCKACREIKPQPCVVCGQVEKVHRHHKDYSKPLEVIFLCPLHHRRVHIGVIKL